MHRNSSPLLTCLSVFVTGLWMLWVPSQLAAQLPAFPGAEGFGSTTIGGRGGQVYTVTNLNPDGPGSFREACQASGPRIVVFAVGGTINLNDVILIDDPYITIAGQTAPKGGITLRISELHDYSPMIITTHDVVLRYIRLRPGPSVEKTTGVDALGIGGEAYNVVVDHCSLSWSLDETLQLWGNATVNGPSAISIQWCIISEALHCSNHALGCHSKSVLLGTTGTHDVSMHHCLVAHNDERNPRFGSTHGVIDFVNNVIYNPVTMGHVSNSGVTEPPTFNYVGNYVKHGPDSELIGPYGPRYELFCWDDGAGYSMYVDGNIGPHRPVDDDNLYPDELVVEPDDRQWMVATPHAAPAITTQSPTQAYDLVLARAGANIPYRDTVDSRIVTDTINGTGSIIDDPSEVGGWPPLPLGTPRVDTDGDGMPNDWETSHGLDPNDPDDASGDRDSDGYTNIEEWFNSLADCGATDTDGDHVGDLCDNCPSLSNTDQLDTDFDGIGDICDPVNGLISPDFDGDGDVDLEDFGHFQACLTGDSVPVTALECERAKLDEDNDIDGDDFVILRACFSGSRTPADPQCDD